MSAEIRPLSAELWPAFEELFGANGACGGCWCMVWRVQSKEWDARKGSRNKQSMRRLVKAGPPPGVLAIAGGKAVGWCAVAPRSDYVRLETSRAMRPVDDEPVWSVSCFFIARGFRRKGLSVKLLRGAVDLARKHGAKIVEGYPVIPSKDKVPDVFAWTGMLATFEKAGFREVHRWLPNRPIMRIDCR